MAAPRILLLNTDPDFNDWQVALNGNRVRHAIVVSADAQKGIVVMFATDGAGNPVPGKPNVSVRGKVTLSPSPVKVKKTAPQVKSAAPVQKAPTPVATAPAPAGQAAPVTTVQAPTPSPMSAGPEKPAS